VHQRGTSMKSFVKLTGPIAVLVLLANIAGTPAADSKRVSVIQTPDRGIQPQAVMDGKGVLHLIYFKGDPGNGDIFYVRREPGQERLSAPIQVNSQAGSAIAVGTIRGAHLALGKNNRVHVAWNGSGKATPQSYGKTSPMLYSRLDDAGKAFEPQRNLMQQTFNLDGGGSVAADEAGNVYVVWHAAKAGMAMGEAGRLVWVAQSKDDGKTFGKEAIANKQPTGACGCCGLKAFVDSKGALHVLYRSATAGVNRDIYMLTSNDTGKSFQNALLQKWNTPQCTMSSEAFAESAAGVFAAWETQRQVYFAKMTAGATKTGSPIAAPGPANQRKHPALASNADGETLFAWTEGTDWQKGGSLAWCLFDKDGKPTREAGRVDGGIPVWGLPTVVATPTGDFIVIH
jgi:hypothetical protein